MVREEILNAVYEFIKNNPNRNQSDIVRGLKGVCTRLPVIDAIDELTSDKDGTKEPKVKFSRNTPKGFYHYFVNDKSEFTKIDQGISEIQMIFDKLIKLIKQQNLKQKHFDFVLHFMQCFQEITLLILESLLIRTHNMIGSLKDSHTLNSKILNLMVSVNILCRHYDLINPKDRIDEYIYNLNILKKQEYTTKKIENIKLVGNLLALGESFKKQFVESNLA